MVSIERVGVLNQAEQSSSTRRFLGPSHPTRPLLPNRDGVYTASTFFGQSDPDDHGNYIASQHILL